jgi:hypothetical protein
VTAVHLDRDGRARCGNCRATRLGEARVVDCLMCLSIMNGTHALGNRQPDEPCGTVAAYRRHYRHGEKPCRSCRQAEARYRADLRRAA